MWCRLSRAVREALQRSGGGATGASPPAPSAAAVAPSSERCISNTQRYADREGAYRRRFDALPHSWFDAFSWTGAVILGWYATQIACLRRKRSHYLDSVEGHNHFWNVCKFEKFQGKENPEETTAGPIWPLLENIKKETTLNSLGLLVNVVDDKKIGQSESSETDKEFKNILRALENRVGIDAIDDGKLQEGVAMLQLSAQRNYPPALFNLAVCYEKGLGVKRDENMAMELYRSAAMKNHSGAMYNLAVFYGQGRGGLTRDVDTAKELLKVAAAQGQKEAISALEMFKDEKRIKNDNEIVAHEPSSTKSFLSAIGCDGGLNFKGANTILSY